jgi:hypothetical protein
VIISLLLSQFLSFICAFQGSLFPDLSLFFA